MEIEYTERQSQYLAFIYYCTIQKFMDIPRQKQLCKSILEFPLLLYINMVVTLEKKGVIKKCPIRRD